MKKEYKEPTLEIIELKKLDIMLASSAGYWEPDPIIIHHKDKNK